jgi:hypothetical protein
MGLVEATARKMPPYERAHFPIQSYVEPHEVDIGSLSALAFRIVQAEGPIHEVEVARRIASCFGKEKAGSRILAAARRALGLAIRQNSELQDADGFYFTHRQAATPPVRDRALESGATLKASSISLLEIREALRLARDENAGGDAADLVRSAARLMGFRRVGPDLQARIQSALKQD